MDRLTRLARERATHDSPTLTNAFRFFSLEEYESMRRGEIWLPNYTRLPHSHPKNFQLEQALTKLEHGSDTLTFGSGMSAIFTVLISLLRPGDSWILIVPCYTGTYLLAEELTKFGIKVKYFNLYQLGKYDMNSFLSALKALTDETTKLVLAENPGNPHTLMIPLACFSSFCDRRGLISVVDNTFASPFNLNPIDYKCDLVIESLTKWFSRGEFMGGSISWDEERLCRKLNGYLEFQGMQFIDVLGRYRMSPLAPELAVRCLKNIKILPRQVGRQNHNAYALAKWLEEAGFKTYYPGLASHPQHDMYKPPICGCIVSFDIGDGDRARLFAKILARDIPLAVSLGSPTTMFQHPAVMTHASIPKDKRLEMGITDGLFRVSCGTESINWLISTFKKALAPFRP